ncbi:MAG: hypothetical protein ACREJ4_08065 [Candidatus Methylomirabilaceae bacterium]
MEWFNDVDATYRNELRELNDLNFARFDARLTSEIDRVFHRLEARMAEFETRIVRSMFLFWAGTLGTVIALLKL